MTKLITNDDLYKFADMIFKIKLINQSFTKKGLNLIYCPKNIDSLIKNDQFLKKIVKTNIPLLGKNPFNLPSEIINIINLFSNNFISWFKYKIRMIWVMESRKLINIYTNQMLYKNNAIYLVAARRKNYLYNKIYLDNINNVYSETQSINDFEYNTYLEYKDKDKE